MGIMLKTKEILKEVEVLESKSVCEGKYIRISTSDGEVFYVYPEELETGECKYYSCFYAPAFCKTGTKVLKIKNKEKKGEY